MFNKYAFSKIIKEIKETYDSQIQFSEKAKIGRTYLSQYMNCKYEKPPKKSILEKLAKASNGVTSYKELAYLCGYLPTPDYIFISNFRKIFDSHKDEFRKIGFSEYDIRVQYLILIGDYPQKFVNKFNESIIKNLGLNKIDIYSEIINRIVKDVKNNQKIINDIIDVVFDDIENELNDAIKTLDSKIEEFEKKSEK